MVHRNLEYKAALIGEFACKRYFYLLNKMPNVLDKMICENILWEHLADIQNTCNAYMDDFRLRLVHSDEYNNSEQKEKLLHERSEAEDDRISIKWICAKNPYDSEEYCMWSAAAQISEVV